MNSSRKHPPEILIPCGFSWSKDRPPEAESSEQREPEPLIAVACVCKWDGDTERGEHTAAK